MAASTVAMLGKIGHRRAHALILVVANVRSAMCGPAETFAMVSVLESQKDLELELSISASVPDMMPYTYIIIPLKTDLGLNESQNSRGRVDIEGHMVIADETNFASISGSDIIPYLCCDHLNNSSIQPTAVLNALMSNDPQPAAILLYSQQGMCCGLTGQDLVYNTILTMADTQDASGVLTITNTSDGTALTTISGYLTEMVQTSGVGQTNENNTTVAMSILYSITGLITLLFIIIIATGAIRARRYPERYGPRSGLGGRPRQSRAKGLARAVLETLPIVKFGGPDPPKPDPNAELEGARGPGPGPGPGPGTAGGARGTADNGPGHHRPSATAAGGLAGSPARVAAAEGAPGEERLGCSICTEDFTVGEDVRVLPCDHKFHPQCVDPWLVNVSGTCPLCRLDLRPEESEGEGEGEGDTAVRGEAPPLGADNEGGDPSPPHAHPHRRSRLFELHRLRHATVEERIEALRRYRTAEQRRGSSGSNEDEGHARTAAGLTDRLRDRFHIRTRAAARRSLSAGLEGGSSSAPTPNTSRG